MPFHKKISDYKSSYFDIFCRVSEEFMILKNRYSALSSLLEQMEHPLTDC